MVKILTENTKISTLLKNNENLNITLKKIIIERENYKNLLTIAAREYFDTNLKQDEFISKIINDSINSFFKQYWSDNKPKDIE